MKTVTLTVRVPQRIAADIARESRARKVSKSDVVRERLAKDKTKAASSSSALDDIADLIGSVDGLPPDVSARTKYYLRKTGYGKVKYADYSKLRR
jgi:hypothetical protein